MRDSEDALGASGKPGNQREVGSDSSEKHLPLQTIAQRLRAARRARHLTQQGLAGTEFSKTFISAIERGRVIPSLQILSQLATRLGVPVSYLLGESEIAPRLLAEFTIWFPVVPRPLYQVSEDKIEPLLGRIEMLVRDNKPPLAWELLGNSSVPPEDWPCKQRIYWYWLAGWTTILLGTPLEAVRLLN